MSGDDVIISTLAVGVCVCFITLTTEERIIEHYSQWMQLFTTILCTLNNFAFVFEHSLLGKVSRDLLIWNETVRLGGVCLSILEDGASYWVSLINWHLWKPNTLAHILIVLSIFDFILYSLTILIVCLCVFQYSHCLVYPVGCFLPHNRVLSVFWLMDKHRGRIMSCVLMDLCLEGHSILLLFPYILLKLYNYSLSLSFSLQK